MITFIKIELKESDDQTNIDKYKVAEKLYQNQSSEESSFQNSR